MYIVKSLPLLLDQQLKKPTQTRSFAVTLPFLRSLLGQIGNFYTTKCRSVWLISRHHQQVYIPAHLKDLNLLIIKEQTKGQRGEYKSIKTNHFISLLLNVYLAFLLFSGKWLTTKSIYYSKGFFCSLIQPCLKCKAFKQNIMTQTLLCVIQMYIQSTILATNT